MVEAPRRRILVPEPKLPELATISKPEIRPCKASSTEVKPKPSNSLASIVCAAKETSRSGIAKPEVSIIFLAVTVTSLIATTFSSNIILYTLLLIGRTCVFKPTKLIFNLFFGFFIFRVKLPFISVTVAEILRFDPSCSTTAAPITGPNESDTVPLILVIPCALTADAMARQQIKIKYFKFFILFNL